MRNLLTYSVLAGMALAGVGCVAQVVPAPGVPRASEGGRTDTTLQDVYRDGAVEAAGRLVGPSASLPAFTPSSVRWISSNTWQVQSFVYDASGHQVHYVATVLHAGETSVVASVALAK